MLPRDLSYRLAELAEDNRSGASWLVAEAARAVATELGALTAGAMRAALPELAQVLAETRPSMAPFWNFANQLALADEHCDDSELLRRVAEVCAWFGDGTPQRLAAVADRARGELRGSARFATHSLSHSVMSTLEKLQEAGRLELVVCTEGAPIREGRALAAGLGELGATVVLTTDAGVYPLLEEVDAVLLGADAVSVTGVRNKTGSFGLAAAARHLRLPVYVLCDSSKLLPAAFADVLPVEPRDPDEVWPRAPVEVANFYFDVTPLQLITAVVTERETLAPHEVRGALDGLSVARLWARVLAEEDATPQAPME